MIAPLALQSPFLHVVLCGRQHEARHVLDPTGALLAGWGLIGLDQQGWWHPRRVFHPAH